MDVEVWTQEMFKVHCSRGYQLRMWQQHKRCCAKLQRFKIALMLWPQAHIEEEEYYNSHRICQQMYQHPLDS